MVDPQDHCLYVARRVCWNRLDQGGTVTSVCLCHLMFPWSSCHRASPISNEVTCSMHVAHFAGPRVTETETARTEDEKHDEHTTSCASPERLHGRPGSIGIAHTARGHLHHLPRMRIVAARIASRKDRLARFCDFKVRG